MTKTLNTRIIQKKDISDNWDISTLIPYEGELILYTDLNKMKMGNGIDLPRDLPFISAETAIKWSTFGNS